MGIQLQAPLVASARRKGGAVMASDGDDMSESKSAWMSAWADRRPPRSEKERHEIMEWASAHLPKAQHRTYISDADINAMKAAFMWRYDEDLPHTETLMAVAIIGYRMALRDNPVKEGK